MVFSFDGALGIHAQMARLRAGKLAVEFGNIANLGTRGYRAREFNTEIKKQELALVCTDDQHIRAEDTTFARTVLRRADPIAANGNDVSLAREQAAMGHNISDLNGTIVFLKHRLSMLSQVIGGRLS